MLQQFCPSLRPSHAGTLLNGHQTVNAFDEIPVGSDQHRWQTEGGWYGIGNFVRPISHISQTWYRLGHNYYWNLIGSRTWTMLCPVTLS